MNAGKNKMGSVSSSEGHMLRDHWCWLEVLTLVQKYQLSPGHDLVGCCTCVEDYSVRSEGNIL